MVSFRYRFVATVDDLVDAEAAARAHLPARVYRAVADAADQLENIHRWIIGGLLALAFVVFTLIARPSDWLVLALVAAGVSAYHFVIAPRRTRARLLAERPAQQAVHLEFGTDGVSIDLEGGHTATRRWDDFTGATATRRGVLLSFGTATMWVPRRAFEDENERLEFLRFIKQYEPSDTPP